MGTAGKRDIQRNSAFFLGAFGTALGALGAYMSGLGLVAHVFRDFAQTAPDWFFALVVVGLIVVVIGAWPALDWLAHRRPDVGGPVLALVGLMYTAIGVAAIRFTDWGLAGWFAVAGGVLLVPAAYLAVVGGGTEPLTWRSLRTPRVQRLEARADRITRVVVGLVTLTGFVIAAVLAAQSGDRLMLVVLIFVGLGGLFWWLLSGSRRR